MKHTRDISIGEALKMQADLYHDCCVALFEDAQNNNAVTKCHLCLNEIQEDDAVRLGWKNDPNPTFICQECAQHIQNALAPSVEDERMLVNLINEQTITP
jgi:uncharacterized protein YlaI